MVLFKHRAFFDSTPVKGVFCAVILLELDINC